MAVEITVYCDECGGIGDAGGSRRVVRMDLYKRGWRRGKGGRDICPKCLYLARRGMAHVLVQRREDEGASDV